MNKDVEHIMGFQVKTSPRQLTEIRNLQYKISDASKGQRIDTETDTAILVNKDSSIIMPVVKFDRNAMTQLSTLKNPFCVTPMTTPEGTSN